MTQGFQLKSSKYRQSKEKLKTAKRLKQSKKAETEQKAKNRAKKLKTEQTFQKHKEGKID